MKRSLTGRITSACVALAVTVAGLGIATAGSAQGAVSPWKTGDPEFTAPKVKPPTIGINYHGLWAQQTDAIRAGILDRYAAAGVNWVRLDMAWEMLQPNNATSYDMNSGVAMIDQRMAELSARGMKALVVFSDAPYWACGTTAKGGQPKNAADYGRALGWAANRWKATAPAWEMWNEPDSTTFFSSGDPAQYAALIKTAYPIAKNLSPTTTFVAGGIQYVKTDWFKAMYANGAKGKYDAVAVHPYIGDASLPPTTPDTNGTNPYLMTHIKSLVDLLAANGEANMKIWATEYGWSTHTNTGSEAYWNKGVTIAQQAAYLLSSMEVLGAYPQVTGAFWYMDRDTTSFAQPQQDNLGLLYNNLDPKPAFFAMKCSASGVCGKPATSSPTPAPTATPAPIPTASATATALPVPASLIPASSSWRYSATGTLPSTSWTASTYVDSGWAAGSSQIGYGDSDEATKVTAGKLAYYMRKSFDAGSSISGVHGLTLTSLVDDGAIVYLNGVEVLRRNMPAGAVTADTRATTAVAGDAEKVWQTTDISSAALKTGVNVLAVEVHNDSLSSSDISFDLKLSTR